MGARLARTQSAIARWASAVVLGGARWPSSAAALEYSARSSAAVSAVMERKNARTAGRSVLAQSRAIVDCTLTAMQSQRNGNGFHDIAKNRIGGFRFFLQ